jgi:hypothetical protein
MDFIWVKADTERRAWRRWDLAVYFVTTEMFDKIGLKRIKRGA